MVTIIKNIDTVIYDGHEWASNRDIIIRKEVFKTNNHVINCLLLSNIPFVYKRIGGFELAEGDRKNCLQDYIDKIHKKINDKDYIEVFETLIKFDVEDEDIVSIIALSSEDQKEVVFVNSEYLNYFKELDNVKFLRFLFIEETKTIVVLYDYPHPLLGLFAIINPKHPKTIGHKERAKEYLQERKRIKLCLSLIRRNNFWGSPFLNVVLGNNSINKWVPIFCPLVSLYYRLSPLERNRKRLKKQNWEVN